MCKYVYDGGMKFGVDVGSIRLDDLDRRVLAYVEGRTKLGLATRVLDVGCGAGGLALALATVGAVVTTLDINDYAAVITAKLEVLPQTAGNVTFLQNDISSFLTQSNMTFDCVVLQRVLHYLPYDEAKKVLTELATRTTLLYVAVTGTTTAIARHYPVLESSIDQRFEILDTAGQELFSITAPVCLYSEAEIKQLLVETGWHVTWSRVSDFGNIKIEASSIKQ
jgi:SAM-dependent methyltransferase